MGTSPQHALGCSIGRKLVAHRRKKAVLQFTIGRRLVQRLGDRVFRLSAKLDAIEFKAFEDIDPTSWHDVYGSVDVRGRRHKGIAHRISNDAFLGARAGLDIQDYLSRRSAAKAESAQVGRFKLTENSPNTARITVGAGRRERRKKYLWERVGFQRDVLAPVASTALIVGGALLHKKVVSAGGIKNLAGKALTSTRKTGARVFGGSKAAAEIPDFVPEKTATQKLADMEADRVAQSTRRKASAAKGMATKTKNYERDFPYGHTLESIPHPLGHPQAGMPSGRKKRVPKPRPPTNPFSGTGAIG